MQIFSQKTLVHTAYFIYFGYATAVVPVIGDGTASGGITMFDVSGSLLDGSDVFGCRFVIS